MRVVVTGAAGFIGHRLVDALLDRGHDVVAIDDLTSGHQYRLDRVRRHARVWQTDIRDTATLGRALAGADVVLHEAAQTSVAASFERPDLTMSINEAGTISVIRAAARVGVGRVVFASSAAVYGDGTLPSREDQRPRPLSPYAVSKANAERHMCALGRRWGLQTVALRYFNVFGPGQDARGSDGAVVPAWITSALIASAPVLYGDGSTTRDLTFIDDIVAANLLAMTTTAGSGAIINVGSGQEHSLLELLGEIGRCVGRELHPELRARRVGDIGRSVADISIARAWLGYRPMLPFSVAIDQTVAWYADHGPGDPVSC